MPRNMYSDCPRTEAFIEFLGFQKETFSRKWLNWVMLFEEHFEGGMAYIDWQEKSYRAVASKLQVASHIFFLLSVWTTGFWFRYSLQYSSDLLTSADRCILAIIFFFPPPIGCRRIEGRNASSFIFHNQVLFTWPHFMHWHSVLYRVTLFLFLREAVLNRSGRKGTLEGKDQERP